MKKSFTLLSAAALCSLTAMAQFGGDPVLSLRGDVSLSFVPVEYSASGIANVYSSYDLKSSTMFTVYDSDFNKVTNFNADCGADYLQVRRYSKLESINVKVREQHPEVITYGGDGQPAVAAVSSNSNSYGYGMGPSDAFVQMQSMFGPEVTQERKGDEYYFYIPNAYYQQDRYGTKYPERYGVWTPASSNAPSELKIVEKSYGEVCTFSKGVAEAFCRDQDYLLMMVDDKVCFFPVDEYEYFMYDRFGKHYPRRCFYLNEDGVLARYNLEYEASAQFADDWKLERGWNEESREMRVCGIEARMAKLGNVDMDDFKISQTLFNNDGMYEYVLPVIQIYEEEQFGTEYLDGVGNYEVKTVSQRERVVGYKVCNEFRQEVSRLTLPADYIGDYLEVVDFGDKRYLTVGAYKEADNGNHVYYTLVYKIDPNASGVMQLVGDPIEVTVAPRVTRRSTPITVKFSGEDNGGDRQVMVTGVNGMTVMTMKVAAGETSANIDTSRLSEGMYVVTVVENGKKIENCKVIIR